MTPLIKVTFSSSCSDVLFSDDVFSVVRAGQTVTHIRSTNSKPQPSNQSMYKIRFRPTFVLVRKAISLGKKDYHNFG